MSVLRNSCLVVLALATSVQGAGPTLDRLFPAGARRGQTVEVRLSGRFERWPVRVWVNEPGVAFEAMPDKGKLLARVDAQAVPGPRFLRVADEQGASTLRPFLVGTVAEEVEKEPNDEPSKAQALGTLPVVVNGRLARRGDVDGFAVDLKRGQTLVAAVEAHRRLGSPMDAAIQIVSSAGIVQQQADDSPGLDPTAAFEAPADGRYLVRVFAFPETPDSSIAFAGGESFIYRLTLTTSATLENALPLACAPAQKSGFEAIGWNLPSGLGPLRADVAGGRVRVWHPDCAGDVSLPIVDHPCLVEGAEASRQPLTPPFSVSGRITRAAEQDRFRVSLKKGKAYRFRVEAQAVGSPLDPVLRLRDGAGKVLAEQDDTTGRDAELSVTAPGDGPFEVAVSDLNDEGSPRHVYLLQVTEPTPDFALDAGDDRVNLTPGKTATLSLKVVRQDGFADPIAIAALGLPPGVSVRPATSASKGETAGAVTLTFEATPAAKAFSGPFQIRGQSGARQLLTRAAVPKIEKASVDQLWLTVAPGGK